MGESYLAKLRMEKNLTQEDLAKDVNVTRQHISAIENRKTNPSIELAKKIAIILEVDWFDLYKEPEEQCI